MDNGRIPVGGGTPGADSAVYELLNTVTSARFGPGALRHRNVSRIIFSLKNSAAGTLKAYHSVDGGTNWDQVEGDYAVTASAATDISGPYDFLVDPYVDFRLTWTNGGSAQATWRPLLTMVIGDRAKGT